MFLKYFTLFIIFFNFFLNLHAAEKQSIINRLSEINNFTFNFEQITKEKIETGNCLLQFDNRLKCSYNDDLQKEILINKKTLAVSQKRYDKIYFYPLSKSPFMNILNKDKLINLIQKSDLKLNDDIELSYVDKNQKNIKVFFEKKNYEIKGWSIEDEFQNEIYFSLKIVRINSDIDSDYFAIPKLIRERN